MKGGNLAVLCALLAPLVIVARVLTSADVVEMKAAIKEAFKLEPSYGVPCNAKLEPCLLGDNIGELVRLAFHDAAGNGGPNGCIDFVHTSAHRGLENVIATLDSIYVPFRPRISRADFWYLAANTAIEAATTAPANGVDSVLDPTPGTLVLPFSYGRQDLAKCDDAGALPDANFHWKDIKNLFGGRFGMTVPEVVAIMGAHSLGRCSYSESSFEGGWTIWQSSLSNQYFKAFGTALWENKNQSDVWLNAGKAGQPNPQTIQLTVDVELLFDTTGSQDGYCNAFSSLDATPRCPFQAESSASFLAYANDINLFYENFSKAWVKLNAAPNLVAVGDQVPQEPSL